MSAFDPDINDTNLLSFSFSEPITAVDKYGKEVVDSDSFKVIF